MTPSICAFRFRPEELVVKHDEDLSSAEYYLSVAGRTSVIAADATVCPVSGFCFIFTPMRVIKMNQKSTLTRRHQCVPWAPTSNIFNGRSEGSAELMKKYPTRSSLAVFVPNCWG